MSAKRISRRTAEQMFRGSSAGHPVADLLNSAAAPGREEELGGEAEVMAAFQAALVDAPALSTASALPAPGERNREKPSLRSLLAKAPTALIAGTALAVTAVGGVAIAANGGVPGHKKAEKPKSSPASVAPPFTRKYAPPPPSPAPAATPTNADLCRKYIAQGMKDENLAPLVKAAGGRKKVVAFCITLLGSDKNKPAGQWPPPGWPTDWPTAWPQNQEWPKELPKEWLQPSGSTQDHKSRKKAKGEADAERQSLWPEDWPKDWSELEFWKQHDKTN